MLIQGRLLDKLNSHILNRKVVMSDCYIKKIEQIDPYISTRGRHTGSIWDPSRLVVVEHDAAVLSEGLVAISSIALSTNWEVDAEWHYADRGGLIMCLPDGYFRRERFERDWEDWCLRHKFKPNFGHRDQPSQIEGRHVSIELLDCDFSSSEKPPQQRLRDHLRFKDFVWDDERLTFSQALKRGKVCNGGLGAQIPDEIVVFTSAGTVAYRLHIGDMDDEYEYSDWLYANP